MKRLIKQGLWICIFAILTAMTADFCHKQTKGFSENKIAAAFPQDLNQTLASDEVLTALSQPFHYLKKGNSAYVFISEDQKYVLKFLRKPNLFPPFWTSYQPLRKIFASYAEPLIQKKAQNKHLLLTSYELAANELPQQTGIFYSHLHASSSLNTKITFFDRIKIKHAMDADKVAFVLQKKAVPFCPYFTKLVEENKQEQIEVLLREFAFLLRERAIKGIFDNDISPHYNLGIFEDHFMAFDLDGLKTCVVPEGSEALKKHMIKDGKKVMRWLKSIRPEFALFLQAKIIEASDLS